MTEIPVLLVHGWACPAGYWEPVASRLRRLGNTVETVTLPGYGAVAPLPDGFGWTVAETAGWLAGKVRRRAAGPVHVVGHSLGGSIAATLAADHPELVATLTLTGMVPVPPSPAVRRRLTELFLVRTEAGEASGPIDPQAADACLRDWYGEVSPAHRAMLEAPFRLPAGVVRASLRAALEGAAPDVADRIAVPVQVIVGAADGTRPPAAVAEFLARHPDWKATAVPGAGHMVHWEAPEACAQAIHALISHPSPAKPQFLQENHLKNSEK